MKIAYFDCFSGMSGDMTLGALVDAGVSLSRLREELARLPVSGYELTAKKVKRAGFRASKVNVEMKIFSSRPSWSQVSWYRFLQ